MSQQELIDRIKANAAALIADIGQLTADPVPTPVPSPTPQPAAELWTQYQSAFLGTKKYRSSVTDSNGKPLSPLVEGTDFPSTFIDSTHGLVTWGDDVEHHAIVAGANGELWSTVEGYGSVADPSIFYPEEVVKCDWTNLDTGVVRDMSAFTPGPVGGIMCPQILPASGRFRLRQWGWVWNKRQADGGVRDHPFYWQVDYLFGTQITNLAWTQDAQQLRNAIKFSEAWWAADIWTRASSALLPWLGALMNPAFDGTSVVYDGYDAFGKGAGTLWQYRSAAYNVGLASAI